MKNTKRFAAFVASVLAVAAMAVPMTSMISSAEETTPSITVSNTNSKHTYEVYQIFKGTLEGTILKGIEWGSNVNSTALTADGATFAGKTAAEAAGMITGGENGNVKSMAAVFAGALTGDPVKTITVAAGATSGSVNLTEAGYYLVKDQANPLKNEHDAMTAYIVEVAGAATVSPKGDFPTVMKKVKEDTNTVTDTAKIGKFTETDTAGGTWNDVADYDIGDAVPFKLYGTLPTNLADYGKYKYVFHDTLGTQFTAPANTAVTVKIDGEETTGATVAVSGQDITVTFDDIINAGAEADSIVTVEYNAVLNSNAAIGLPGQENKVNLTYSNNPNWAAEGKTTPGDEGKTPDDKVIVFTYALEVSKKFVNTKNEDLTEEEKENGTYTDVIFNLKDEAGNVLTFSEGTETVEGKEVKYYYPDKNGNAALNIDAECRFNVRGLDEGKYTLVEIQAPAGFNTAPAKTIEISAVTKNDQAWSEVPADALTEFSYKVGDTTVVQNKDAETPEIDAIAKATIENKKGSSLPSTGGVGTTIFFTAGGALVLGAGVLLISKKRMTNK